MALEDTEVGKGQEGEESSLLIEKGPEEAEWAEEGREGSGAPAQSFTWTGGGRLLLRGGKGVSDIMGVP